MGVILRNFDNYLIASAELDSESSRVLIFRDGVNRAMWSNGESIEAIMDATAAKAVADRFASMGRDIVFDYEHQSVGGGYSRIDGKAPAAGWITGFDYVPGEGLYATVNWLDAARPLIESKEYRYFSPVFYVDPDTSRVTEIRSVALTNDPALIGLLPLAASKFPKALERNMTPIEKEPIMADELKALKALDKQLGGDVAESDDAVIASVRGKVKSTLQDSEKTTNALKAVAKALGTDADGDKLVAAVAALKDGANVDPTKYVAMADFATVKAQLDSLSESADARDKAEFLDRGQSAGKITASNRDHWAWVFDTDPKTANEHLEKAPVIVATGRITTDNEPQRDERKAVIAKARKGYAELDRQTKAVCTTKAFVNNELRIANYRPLTEEELTEIGVE